MRPQDKHHFSAAARPGTIHPAGLWILVRRTNSESLKYMGQPDCRPKGMDCKAKTAHRNVGLIQHAGLVVDPSVSPHSFNPEKLDGAIREWRNFIAKNPLSPWQVDAHGHSLPTAQQPICCVNTNLQDTQRYGCLLYHHYYLHGDYDLYDIVLADQTTRNLAAVGADPAQPSTRGRYLSAIEDYVNHRIGVNMVLHGAQAQGFGHIDDDTVDVFPPNGEPFAIPNASGVVAWYERTFPGRKAIDLRTPQGYVPRGGRPRLV